ncbi:hypothetical protein GpartN1_g731.t1 [Galdieria partita]|uniref:Uncharacterized protein n=1 Tax=Galdieria partita TaxID=83374 RepID=A0A9C7PR30_9RHOD|nr:hypothetical protein GpartN1_g731.t1 [Galdieria partita]
MVLTRSSSKKTPVQNEEKKEETIAVETPVRKLSRELASLGIRAPPGTPCQQSSPNFGRSQVPKTDTGLDQIAEQGQESEESQLLCSLGENDNPELCATTLAVRAAMGSHNLINRVALSDLEETNLKGIFNSQETELQRDSDTHHSIEDDDDKVLQEKQTQDSCNMVSTPVNQAAEVSFQLIGNDASNEWCGEHVRFSVLGKSKVKVYHQPGLQTVSPNRNNEKRQEDGDTPVIEEDFLDDATPEPQRLNFDIHSEFLKSDDNPNSSIAESKISYLASSNEIKTDSLCTNEATSGKSKENGLELTHESNRSESKENRESSKKKSQVTPTKCLTENSHFSKHTQSSAAKDKRLTLERNLQRDKENIDKSGNSIHWKGQHIRFEDSPDTIEEKMKSLRLDHARFMKTTVSAAAKRSENGHKQELASKYLWKF